MIPGTVPFEIRGTKSGKEINIGHPGGIVDVEAECDWQNGNPVITRVTYARTARRIMDGYCYVPKRCFEEE